MPSLTVYGLFNEYAESDGYDAHQLIGVYSTQDEAQQDADRLATLSWKESGFQVCVLTIKPLTVDAGYSSRPYPNE